METQTLPSAPAAHPDSGFELPPCPASPSDPPPQPPSDPVPSQHPHPHPKLSLTQNPHPESRESRAAGWRGGGGLSNWHRLPAKHTRERHHSLHRTLVLCSPHLLKPASTASYSRCLARHALLGLFPCEAHAWPLSRPLSLAFFTRKKGPCTCEVCFHAQSSGDHAEAHLISSDPQEKNFCHRISGLAFY